MQLAFAPDAPAALTFLPLAEDTILTFLCAIILPNDQNMQP
jgi:hypothetical protein